MKLWTDEREIRTREEADSWEAQGPAGAVAFDCAVANHDRVLAEYGRLCKKATAVGVGLPWLRVCPFDHIVQRRVEDRDEDGRPVGQHTVKVRVVRMVAGGEEIVKDGGWTLVAVVDWLDGNPVVRCFPGEGLGVMSYSLHHRGPVCDHCKLHRDRNQTIILRHDQSPAKVQVGTTCLKEYTGIDPAYALALAGWYQATGEAANTTRYEEDLYGFLDWVAVAVRVTGGFVSRRQADLAEERGERRPRTTAEEAGTLRQEAYNNPAAPRPAEEDQTLVHKVVSWVATLDPEESQYNANLRAIFNSGILIPRHTGLAASAVGSYMREEQRATEARIKAATTRPSEWLGAEGQRVTCQYTVTGCTVNEGAYGTTWIYRLLTAGGDRATWFSTRDALTVGETVTLVGTIKKLETYRGEKGTVLTRCRRV